MDEKQYLVWHVPQVPMEAFRVKVSSLQEGLAILDVLADYDRFQYAHRVKPDYANAQGIQEQFINDEGKLDWRDFYSEEYDTDDPREAFELMKNDSKNKGIR